MAGRDLTTLPANELVAERDAAEAALHHASTALLDGALTEADLAAYEEIRDRRDRLEAERQRRVMVAMRAPGANG